MFGSVRLFVCLSELEIDVSQLASFLNHHILNDTLTQQILLRVQSITCQKLVTKSAKLCNQLGPCLGRNWDPIQVMFQDIFWGIIQNVIQVTLQSIKWSTTFPGECPVSHIVNILWRARPTLCQQIAQLLSLFIPEQVDSVNQSG